MLTTYGIEKAIAPPPRLTVDQHAERTLYLSERTSAIAGLIRFDYTPYLRKPLQMFTDPRVSTISFMTGTQIGKTVFLFAILNYIVDYAPGPTMMLYPSMDLAKDISKDRIQPLFSDCPSLRAHKTGIDDDFQLLRYTLDRMTIRFAWNSLSSVSSHPEKYLIKDETKNVDPLILNAANDRTKTYPSRKIIEASSPLDLQDNIWRSVGLKRDYDAEEHAKLQAGDIDAGRRIPIRRWKPGGSNSVYIYLVPCPHCHQFQQLYPDRIIWPRDCAIRDLTYRASYICSYCSDEIKEHMKCDMIRRGKWRCDHPGSTSQAFYLSSLYSILGSACTFGEIAAQYLRAHISKRPESMQAFINGFLAWPFEEEEFGADTISLSEVVERNDGYRKNQLPLDVKMITAAVDVHRKSLYWSIFGWGGVNEFDRDGYLLSWGIFDVDIDVDPDSAMEKICSIRKMTFENDANKLGVIGVGIDSGYKAMEVYAWARKLKWLKPIKGVRGDVLVPNGLEKYIQSTTRVDKMPDGRVISGGLLLRILNTGMIKREIYASINAGRIHFPVDVEQVFISQLNSEKLVTRIAPRSGKLHKYYVKKKSGDINEGDPVITRNHYLDTAVYNYAMLEIIAAGMNLSHAARKYYRTVKQTVNNATYMEI